MQIPLADWFLGTFNLELPDYESLDECVDFILPKIVPYSEDLYETAFYTEKPWLEVRDDEQFLNAVLHIFKQPDGEVIIKSKGEDEGPDYLKSVDGNVIKGSWTFLKGQNSRIMLLKTPVSYELYEKAFINADFFILKKHGNNHLDGRRKYFFMGREGLVRGLEWREATEILYNIYRFRFRYMSFIAIAVFLVFIFLFFSMF